MTTSEYVNKLQKYAAVYIRGGLNIIPLQLKSKNPNRKDWQYERYTVEQISQVFSTPKNMGVILNTGIVDVDLDCPEAICLAPRYLATTMTFGRKSKRRSHSIYKCTNPEKYKKFEVKAEGKKATVVEYRSGEGFQTVFPPSIHEEGEEIDFDSTVKVATADGAELYQQVSRLAAASLLLRNMVEGVRDDLITTMTGVLLRSGWTTEAIDAFLEPVADAADFSYASKAEYQRERLEKDAHVFGVPKLKETVGDEIAKCILDWLKIKVPIEQAECTSMNWTEPTPLPEFPPVKALKPEMVPAPLRGWLVDMAHRMQIPLDFAVVAAIVALSAIIGRACAIYPKRADNWLVVVNLWGALVGRPSLMKTPAINEAQRPLFRLESEAREEYLTLLHASEIDKEIMKAERSAILEEIKKAAKNNKPTDCLREKLLSLSIEEPVRRRYQTQDATVEMIGELLIQNPRGLMVNRDELIGWLCLLDKPGRDGDRAFYLEGWNGSGRSYTVDRIGRGTLDIPALCLSVFGAITPGPLSEYVRQAKQGGKDDDGLMQRFQLTVWPDAPKKWENVDQLPDFGQQQRAEKIFSVLSGDIPGAASNSDSEIPALRFSPQAQEIFDKWRNGLEVRLRGDHGLPPAMESHLTKYRSLMPSLSLIFHLVDVADGITAPGPVQEHSAVLAVQWCEYLESHAARLYGSAITAGLEEAQEIIKHIKLGDIKDGVTIREVWRHGWSRLKTSEEVKAGTGLLQEYGWLIVEKTDTGGRPSEVVRLNPHITK